MKQDAKSRFCLRINDDFKWNIYAIPPTRSWTEKFANILSLEDAKSEDLPGIYILQSSESWDKCDRLLTDILNYTNRTLPDSGWYLQDYKVVKVWVNDNNKEIIYLINDTTSSEIELITMWLSLLPIFEKAININGLPLHAALAAKESKGILFVGPGGRGKTTASRRLPAPWSELCDDEVLVIPRLESGYQAHPFPTWSELLWHESNRTWNISQNLPVCAIFLINKSESDEVRRIGIGAAAVALFNSSMQVFDRGWRKIKPEMAVKYKKLAFNSACELASSVKTYKLNMTLDGKFWNLIEKVLEDDI